MAAQKQRLTRTYRTYTKSQRSIWNKNDSPQLGAKKNRQKTPKKREFNGFFQIEITMPGELGKAYINN